MQSITTDKDNIIKVDKINTPTMIHELLQQSYRHKYMGLLSEIGYAWVSIDNRLYLWNYDTEGAKDDIYTYNDQDQVIYKVILVKPKPGVFDDFIEYLLVVATPLQFILLGVSFKPYPSQMTHNISISDSDSSRCMKLLATDLSVSSDDIQITSINGTNNGRIFMTANNGHLYELDYQSPQKWFGSTCSLKCLTGAGISSYVPTLFRSSFTGNYRSITIDNERNVLYLLTTKSEIEVFYIGPSQTEFTHVAKNTDILNSARQMCRPMMYDANHFEIESLHIITKSESKKIHLVAVTKRGFRLYFTHERNGVRTSYTQQTFNSNNNNTITPNALELVHVRLPSPPKASHQNIQPYQNIETSYYSCGVFLASEKNVLQSTIEERRTVYMSSAAIEGIIKQPTSTGYGYVSQHPPFVESITELEYNWMPYTILEVNSKRKGKYPINDIGEQLTDTPRKFMILTIEGLTVFNKPRPVDILYNLLLNPQFHSEPSQRDILSFFEHYGPTETCAMCLSIICARHTFNSSDQRLVGTRAKKLFFDFGGEPSASGTAPISGNFLGQAVGPTGVKYSNKHDGLALYFSRLISSVWKKKMFEISFKETKKGTMNSVQLEFLPVKQNLIRLKQFMDENPDFHRPASIYNVKFQLAELSDQNTLQLLLQEQQSLHELYQLLTQCIDAITYMAFVIDSNVNEILQSVQDSVKNEILEMTLENILSSSRGIILRRDLVVATIFNYRSNHRVEHSYISNFLQKRCPSFFDSSDMNFYQGVEYLHYAYKPGAEYEETKVALDESLKYFKEVADSISEDKMTAICEEYRRQQYYEGVIEFALERARKLDPHEKGLLYMESKMRPGDSRVQSYDLRLRCYDHIFVTLTEIKNLQSDKGYNNISERNDNSNSGGNMDPNTLFDAILQRALSHDDKLFHYTLYQWFLQNDRSRELLWVDSKYIIPFFKQHVSELDSIQFLWQYYRRHQQYYEAALYLEALANRSPNITTDKRLEYIGLALWYAQSQEASDKPTQKTRQLIIRLQSQMDSIMGQSVTEQ
ncbi:unnamed protein product [Cunninghamella echinulata]